MLLAASAWLVNLFMAHVFSQCCALPGCGTATCLPAAAPHVSGCHLLQLLYFDAASGRQLKDSCRDTRWASYSCCLGFPVMGIWPPDR